MQLHKKNLLDLLSEFRSWKTIIIGILILWHFVFAGLLTHTFKLLPDYARRMTELYIAVLAIAVIIWRLVKRKKLHWITSDWPFAVIPFGFLVLVCLSALINHVPFQPFFEQIVWYFRFYVLAMAIVNLELSKNSIKTLTLLILTIILLQIPVTLIQCSLWTLGDWTVGTMTPSSTTDIAFLCCIGVLLIFYAHINTKISKWCLLIIPLLVIPIVCGNNQMGVLLIPFSLLHAGIMRFPQSLKIMGFILLFTIIILAIVLFIFPFFKKSTFRYFEIYNTAVVHQFVSSPDSLGRLRAPAVAYENISYDWQTMLFGHGFGRIRSRQLGYESISAFDKRLFWQNQISTSLVETGILGLIYVLILPFLIMVWAYKKLKKHATEFSRPLLSTFFGTTLLFLIGFIYTQVLGSNHFSFVFWILFAFTWIAAGNLIRQNVN